LLDVINHTFRERFSAHDSAAANGLARFCVRGRRLQLRFGRCTAPLERFPAKWIPVCVKKTRQNKKESRSDSIGKGSSVDGEVKQS
jgi:hypothetical protein